MFNKPSKKITAILAISLMASTPARANIISALCWFAGTVPCTILSALTTKKIAKNKASEKKQPSKTERVLLRTGQVGGRVGATYCVGRGVLEIIKTVVDKTTQITKPMNGFTSTQD